MLLSQFPLTFHNIDNGMPCFITLLMTPLVLIGMVFMIIWEMFHGRISWNSLFLLLLVNFVSGFRLGLMFIFHKMYQVKSHSSPWFSVVCAAAIVHRNHSFCFYQKDKSSESKVKFRLASNCCKSFLEATNKTKESITSQKLGCQNFWRIVNSVLNKGKSAIHPQFNTQRCCFLHLIKQKCLLKTFLGTLILMT